MQELVTHVIKTDIETGAATLDALINYAGMLIAQNRIEDFSIIFFNIHNFKYVNKVLNYEQGDVVLRNYTKTIYRNLSDGEMIARLGGDNFVMLVKNESLREYIDMLSFMNIRYDDGKVSKDFIFSATIGYSSTVGIRYPREVMARASIAYAAARRVGAGHVIEYSENIKQELMKIQECCQTSWLGLWQVSSRCIISQRYASKPRRYLVQKPLYVGIEREGYQHRWSLFRFSRMTEA